MSDITRRQILTVGAPGIAGLTGAIERVSHLCDRRPEICCM